MRLQKFVICEPKLMNFFVYNVEQIIVENDAFRFLIFLSIPKMRAKSKVTRKRMRCRFWVDQNEQVELCNQWAKVHPIFCTTQEKSWLITPICCLSIAPSVPVISVVKFESCPKLRRILEVFALPNFKEMVPPKKPLRQANTLSLVEGLKTLLLLGSN